MFLTKEREVLKTTSRDPLGYNVSRDCTAPPGALSFVSKFFLCTCTRPKSPYKKNPDSCVREGSLGVYTNRKACAVSTLQDHFHIGLPALLVPLMWCSLRSRSAVPIALQAIKNRWSKEKELVDDFFCFPLDVAFHFVNLL